MLRNRREGGNESRRTFEIAFLNGRDPVLLHLQLLQHVQSAQRRRRHFGQIVSSEIQSPQLSATVQTYPFTCNLILRRLFKSDFTRLIGSDKDRSNGRTSDAMKFVAG